MKEDLPFLFGAYTVIWGLVAAYVGLLFIRQANIRRQIQDLKRELSEERSKIS